MVLVIGNIGYIDKMLAILAMPVPILSVYSVLDASKFDMIFTICIGIGRYLEDLALNFQRGPKGNEYKLLPYVFICF